MSILTRDTFAQQSPQALPALMLDYWFAVICHYLYLAILLSDATSLKTGCNPQSKTKKAHIFTYSVFLEIFAFLAKHF